LCFSTSRVSLRRLSEPVTDLDADSYQAHLSTVTPRPRSTCSSTILETPAEATGRRQWATGSPTLFTSQPTNTSAAFSTLSFSCKGHLVRSSSSTHSQPPVIILLALSTEFDLTFVLYLSFFSTHSTIAVTFSGAEPPRIILVCLTPSPRIHALVASRYTLPAIIQQETTFYFSTSDTRFVDRWTFRGVTARRPLDFSNTQASFYTILSTSLAVIFRAMV